MLNLLTSTLLVAYIVLFLLFIASLAQLLRNPKESTSVQRSFALQGVIFCPLAIVILIYLPTLAGHLKGN